jgi:hypothetical protein
MVNGLSFLPTANGHITVYKQTIVNIDVAAGIYDTTEILLREIMRGQIGEASDALLHRVEVQRFNAAELRWLPHNTYELQLSALRIARVDTNTVIVILHFPQVENKSWQGNVLNTNPAERFKYTAVNMDTIIQSQHYDSVSEVTQRNFETMYSLQRQKELYRQGIGLLRREVYNVESQHLPGKPLDLSKPLLDRLTKGKIEITEILNQ